jgi:hypothetical protein
VAAFLPLRVRHVVRRGLIDHLDSHIKASHPAGVALVLATHGKAIGLTTPTTRELTRIITGRLTNTLSHQDASTDLATLATTLAPTPLTWDTWLTLENIARSIGCFHASHHFTQHATHRILNTPHPSPLRFTSHLHNRNLPDAQHIWDTLPPRKKRHPFWQDAGHYLWHWSQHTHGTPHHTSDTSWTTLLTGHHITILGPAPTSHTPPAPPHLTARVIVPGVLSWQEDSGPFGSSCDLAYANSRSTKWFIKNLSPEAFSGFQRVSFRSEKWQALGLSNGRTSTSHERLLLLPSDKTNMVPLMVWDVLAVNDVTVTVAGTTFFATAASYTPDNLRFSHSARGQADERGSSGGVFERCLSFSHHAVSQQLSFLGNLVSAGVVAIDREGAEVMALTDEQYLTRLDDLYGVERL